MNHGVSAGDGVEIAAQGNGAGVRPEFFHQAAADEAGGTCDGDGHDFSQMNVFMFLMR